MATIQFAFEGDMERAAIPQLLATVGRVARERGVKIGRSPRYRGRPDLLKDLPRLVGQACRRDADAHLVALVDYHPADPSWTNPQEMQQAAKAKVDRRLRSRLHVHLAIHDIEAWVLASPVGLCRMLRLTDVLNWQSPEQVNLHRPPKQVIKELFRKHRPRPGYRETVEGVALLAGLDRALVYARCNGFCNLIDDLAAMLGVATTELLE